MKLQKHLLLAYKQYRVSPPAPFTAMLRGWRVLLLLTAGMAVLGGFSILFLQMNHLAWMTAGALIGAIAREFGIMRRAARSWPTLSAIIDWNRVDELLDKEQS